MNWSKLLPSTWWPQDAVRKLSNPDQHIAMEGLRDAVILLAILIAALCAGFVLWQTWTSLKRTHQYLKATRDGENAASGVIDSNLPLFRELRHHLIDFSSNDGTGQTSKRRTVDAAEVFRESSLGPAFSSSRLILAIPSILTGLGVFGTFMGLQLGIGSLDFEHLEVSIKPLINSCAVAFSSSVWGVGASLVISGWEKFFEGIALRRVNTIQNRVDALFPRYAPEVALLEMERTSRGTDDSLKGLAVAIGAEMQQAIGRLGSEIKDAVSNATAEGHGPLMAQSAELLSSALTAELAKLKEQIGNMADQFSDKFNGVSDGMMKSVQSFQPTVEALSGAVGDAQRTVADAVAKLNSHESVMGEMVGAALNIKHAAEVFGSMNETLSLSAARNEEASKAQLSAAQSNERVAEQFGRIGEGLPKISETVEAAARVIGSLGSPIRDLQVLLEGQPELQRQIDTARSTSESERSQLLFSMAGNLAEKVGLAAQQFAEVGALADKLTASATSLEGASSELAVFGKQVVQASKDQRDASEASRAAAASGERAAKALEPLPGAITALAGGLTSAGTSVREGAETARNSYRELIDLQKKWFEGAELGLNGMKDRLQTLLKAYGDQVEGQTRNLMKQWTEEVASCLQSYETQVSELQGGLDELQSAISKLSK
jgi:methyl-accepting chemotaxis protein